MEANNVSPKVFEPSTEAIGKFDKAIDEYRRLTGDASAMLPDHLVRQTEMFAENQAWANSLKLEGYTVLDLGNPNKIAASSPFYEMEKLILF